jgi:uncharacterized membrane protein YhaH (DUF805 family)
MDFGQAVRSCFSKYATFSGRAPRSEYWYFVLFSFFVHLPANLLDHLLFRELALFGPLVGLALMLPSFAVTVRRLHDRDQSGWWFLLFFLPLIGAIVLLVWFCQRGTLGPNRFGPDPLGFAGSDARLSRA